MMSRSRTAPCPQCGADTDMTNANPYRPFCSRRCKLIDLGDWLDESNRIPDPDDTTPFTPYGNEPRH